MYTLAPCDAVLLVADERIAAVFARAGGGVIGYKRAVNDRRITHLAPQQELGVLPKRWAWAHCLDSACAGSYGPALEIEVTELLQEKELAS